jgi:hypothetical protein
MVSRERDRKVIEPRGIVQHQLSLSVFHLALSCAKQTLSTAIHCTFAARRTT